MNFNVVHEIIGNPSVQGWEVRIDEKEKIYLIKSRLTNKESLAAKIVGDKIILIGIGDVEAWIRRGDRVSKLISKTSQITSIQGPITSGDEITLGGSSAKLLKLKLQAIQIPKMETANQNPKTATVKKLSPIRRWLASLIDLILKILPPKDNYVKNDLVNPESSRKKKMATTLGAILFVMLIISIIFGRNEKNKIDQRSQYEPILTSIKHDLEEAESLSSVNNAQSRELILNSNSKINDLISKKINDPRITELKKRIQNDLGKIAGIYQENLSTFLDLTILSNDFKGNDMTADSHRLAVLDANGRRLETIDITSGRADPIQIPDILPSVKGVSIYSDRNFISTENGIWEIGGNAKIAVPKQNNFGGNIQMASYAGNLYVLDKDSSSLLRFRGEGSSFAPKENWLAEGIRPDLSKVISWAIDGKIWLLTMSGQVLKFDGGSPIDFSLKNMDKEPKPVDIYTNEDDKYIYLLDNENSRILVVDKDGNYKAQYLADNIKESTKIIASEPAKKIILLAGSKLYSLDIKHLE